MSLCGACGERTSGDPCESCGVSPLVDGRYELLEELGRGGLGTTFRARSPDGSIVALKELPYRRAHDLKTLELFEREARVLRELDHPGIPRYIDHFVSGVGKHRALYLAQELIEGTTLEDEVGRKRLTERELLALLSAVADVLIYLHGLRPPVIHRDLKPANLMRERSESRASRVRLLDFGSVRDVLKDTKLGGSTVTGTYGFMAPEQFQGLATPATDIYGLGVTALVLASRLAPQELFDPLGRELWTSRVPLSKPLTQLLQSMTEPDATQRLGSARELREAIDRVARGHSPFPAAARAPIVPVAPPPPPPRRDAVKLATVGLAGSAVVLVARILLPVTSELAIALGAPMVLIAFTGALSAIRVRSNAS